MTQICSDDNMLPLLSTLTPQAALWLAVHDVDTSNADVARKLWKTAGGDVHTPEFIVAESLHLGAQGPEVRQACAASLGAACGTDSALLAVLCAQITGAYAGGAIPPATRRAGCGLAIKVVAPRLTDVDAVLDLMQFVLEKGLTDSSNEARECMLEGGTALVDSHGASQLQRMMPLIERYLENDGSFTEDQYDQVWPVHEYAQL